MSKAWSKVRLGDICRMARGTSPTLKTLPGPFPLVVTAEFRRTADTWQIEGPAVCIPLISSTGHGDAAIHRVHYQEGRFALANLLVALLPNDPTFCDTKYLFHLLMAKKDELLVPLMQGTANVSLKEQDIAGVEIDLPTLESQRRVVARIEQLAEQIQKARKLRREAVEEAEALAGAASLARFSRLGQLLKVGEACQVIDPNPSHRYPLYVPDGVPIISSSEFVGEDEIDSSRAKCVPTSFYETTLGRFNVGKGDVIFSRKGKVGYARLHPEDRKLAMTHTLCVLKPDHSLLDSRFLLHFARSPTFLEELTGTMNPNVGVPTLGLGLIRAAGIPVPPLPEQRRIVAELDALQAEADALKLLQSETEAELNALLPAILDRAFKGEL